MILDENIKLKVLQAIESKVSVFRKGSNNQYRIRCPICGDSQRNQNDSHLYLKCSPDPTEPILYKCFKCNAHGKVNRRFLEMLDIELPGIEEFDRKTFNRLTSVKEAKVEVLTGNVNMKSYQVGYTEHRLGPGFTKQDYDRFKIIWDMNMIKPYASTQRVRNTLPSNNDSISFLSEDRSMLLTRFFNPGDGPGWKKTKLFPSDNQRAFYTVASTLDLFTRDPINIHITEGVFDALGVYKNFNTGNNSVYIAFLGKDYEAAIDYVVAKGLMGGNVQLRVYLDSDVDRTPIRIKLRGLRWLFGAIHLAWNSAGEDFGVPIDQVRLTEQKIL